jgi:hypothetical protein
LEALINTKRSRKKKEIAQGLLLISAEEKTQALERWERIYREKYRVEISRYWKEQRELTALGAKAFFLAVLEKGQPLLACPQRYKLPTKEEVKKVLERAAKEAMRALAG